MTAARLLKYFDRVSEAPDAVPRLRRFILDLAVRGKLVDQDPREESAAPLLQRLNAAKRALKSSHPVLQETSERQTIAPVRLPSSWVWAPFGAVATIKSNLVDPRDYPDAPHIAPDNIERASGRLLAYETVKQSRVTSAKHRFYAGAILYSKIRPALAKVVVVDFDGLCSADMYPILSAINRDYLHKFMLSHVFVEQSVSEDNRVAMPKINQAALSRVLVAVPPLPEQHRIAAKVDELMALCDRLEAAGEQRETRRSLVVASSLRLLSGARQTDQFGADSNFPLKHLPSVMGRIQDLTALRRTILDLAARGRLVRQSDGDESAVALHRDLVAMRKRLLREGRTVTRARVVNAVEDIGVDTFPSSWILTNFDEVNIIASGVAKGKNLRGLRTATYPYLRVANVQRGYLDLTVVKNLEIAAADIERYRLKPGDVLMTEGGDWDKLGRAAIWRGEIDNCIHQNHVFRIRPAAIDKLLPQWVTLFANSRLGRSYFESAAKQTTNLASINMTQLRSCPLPLPPTAEQQRIVAKVDELMSLCDRLEAQIATGETASSRLLDALLHEALDSTTAAT
jgi:type I restriction enzyme, S subunit